MPQKGGAKDDFFLIESTGLACQKLVCDLVSTRLPKAYGFDPGQGHSGALPDEGRPHRQRGAEQEIAGNFEPACQGPRPDRHRGKCKILRLGDKVMQVKTTTTSPLSATVPRLASARTMATLGIITAVDVDARAVTVMMDDRKYTYTADQLNELEPAYAVTVHKARARSSRRWSCRWPMCPPGCATATFCIPA